jgi:hypothetical protein
MADVAPLAYAANSITEPALVILAESFDRLIEQAYQSVREDKISVFDQAQINSFIAGRSGRHDRMLMVKLGKTHSVHTRACRSAFSTLYIEQASQPRAFPYHRGSIAPRCFTWIRSFV